VWKFSNTSPKQGKNIMWAGVGRFGGLDECTDARNFMENAIARYYYYYYKNELLQLRSRGDIGCFCHEFRVRG
jgi:hypothetical protein